MSRSLQLIAQPPFSSQLLFPPIVFSFFDSPAVQEHALYGALVTKFRTLTLGRRAFIAWFRAIKAKRQQRRTLHSGYEWRILFTGKHALRQWKAKITLALAQKRAKQRLWPRYVKLFSLLCDMVLMMCNT